LQPVDFFYLSRMALLLQNIVIPNTIMSIATAAEIMWTKQRFNDLICGIRFTDMLE
jgi:hypothetical protein